MKNHCESGKASQNNLPITHSIRLTVWVKSIFAHSVYSAGKNNMEINKGL